MAEEGISCRHGASSPPDQEITRMIREEVREAVKNEIQEIGLVPPPLYDSKDATSGSTATAAKGEVQTQGPTDQEAGPAGMDEAITRPKTGKQKIGYLVIWFPILAWVVLLTTFAVKKTFPLDIVPVSGILMVVTYVFSLVLLLVSLSSFPGIHLQEDILNSD
jgi:hypothetical protein